MHKYASIEKTAEFCYCHVFLIVFMFYICFSLQPSHYESPAPSYSPAAMHARGLNLNLSQRLLPASNLYGMAGAPQPKYVNQLLMLYFASILTY